MARQLRVLLALAAVVAFGTPAWPQTRSYALTGGVEQYTVEKGDTLGLLASRFGIDASVLASENGLKANAALPIGQPLRIDNRHIVPAAAEPGAIVVNIPQRMLFFGEGASVSGLPIAVGKRDWKTPIGAFTVRTKEIDPSWEVPASIQEEARRAGKTLPAVVRPGPNNPLGKYWLGLTIPNVGIHGTNAPSSIYRVTTHGCIRVGPADMAWLFERVSAGTRGVVIYEPILLAVIDRDVFLEVHPDVYGRLANPAAYVQALIEAAGVAGDVDAAAMARVLAERHGIARRVGLLKNSPASTDFSG